MAVFFQRVNPCGLERVCTLVGSRATVHALALWALGVSRVSTHVYGNAKGPPPPPRVLREKKAVLQSRKLSSPANPCCMS